MKQYQAGKIKNIALAGHGGSGKTSLAEALLFKAGELDRLGTVEGGGTAMDFDPEETKRKISISTSVYPLGWKDVKINLVDTPGLFDFAGGLYEGVRAAESVVVALSGRSGVEVGTKKAYKLAQKMGKARVFFISRLDVEHADFYKVFAGLKEAFGGGVCPVVVPVMEGDKVACYVNLIENKAYKYDGKGGRSETPVPGGFAGQLEELVAELSEAVAETDEELMEKFFGGESFTGEELARGLQNGLREGSISPVFCGSATTLEGIDLLLDCIAGQFPSAADCAGETAMTEKDEAVRIDCDENAPFAAYVFKTVSDPFVGKLSYVKVVAGKLSGDLTPVNTRTEKAERMGKIIYLKGKKQEETASVGAGDIVALTKLSETKTGDSLCDPKRKVTFTAIEFPRPTLSMAVSAKNKADVDKVGQGLNRLIVEDPTIMFSLNAETRQQLLSGLGDQHIDVIVSKLKNKFGVDVELITPRVPYRETIRKKVNVQGKHKKQTGGSGQFGDVWIEFEPHDGEELIFQERVVGGKVPRNFFPAVEKGLQQAVKRGMIAGYPMVGVKATLYEGSYHAVDSSDMAFQLAAQLAYRNGIPQASPILLEPIGNLKVAVPDNYTGDIMGDLAKRGGRVLGMNPTDDGLQEIEGEVPMSAMHDFTTILRSMTQGQGHYSLTFERYDPLPKDREAAVIEDAKKMNEEE
jgi:elongation factor G